MSCPAAPRPSPSSCCHEPFNVGISYIEDGLTSAGYQQKPVARLAKAKAGAWAAAPARPWPQGCLSISGQEDYQDGDINQLAN